MDAKRFDAITKALQGVSRRHVLQGLVGSLTGIMVSPLGAGLTTAGTRGPGEPCRRKRQCQRALTCQNKVCCAVAGDICQEDQECCSGACDPQDKLCLCSTTLEPVCGTQCCNPLTQACQNDRCCKLDGVRCDRDGQCCSGDCKNGRCSECPASLPLRCPPTAQAPGGWCCPSCGSCGCTGAPDPCCTVPIGCS